MADTNIIKLGNNDLNFKVGSSDCKIYLGDILLYPKDVPPTPPSFDGKYKLILTDDSVVSGECDASSAITTNETSAYKTTLKEAVIGDCVTSIGDYALQNCNSLSSVTIPSGVTSIGQYAFAGCTSLSSVTITDSVTSIGQGAFQNCTSLSSVTIPNSVTSIGNSVFYSCDNLTDATILNNTISSHAFDDCFSLSSVTIGSGVTSIGNGAFRYCGSLTSITIPSSVTSIDYSAFQKCSGLTSITVEATTPPTLGYPLPFVETNNCPIYVPCSSVDTFKAASGWSTYADRIACVSPPIDYSTEHLSIVAETDNVTVTLYGGTSSNQFQYSLDSGTTWNSLQIGQTSPSFNQGEKIMFKASGLTINNDAGIGTIRPSASAAVEGNIMSLLYGDNFSEQTVIPNNFNLRKLFSGATNITSAENLVIPATTVTKQCYSQMFQGCTNLTTAPKVIGSSAMTWSGDYCWSDMFHGCTSLVNAPQLPATTLGTQCYWFMFQDCTSLETAPVLPAITLNNQCYQGMFNGCSSLNYIKAMFTTAPSTTYTNSWVSGVASSGTFVKNSAATWTVNCGTSAVPCNWNVITE